MAVKSSFRNMTLCLFVICLVCSALLAGVNELTRGPIDAAAQAKVQKAVAEVVPEFDILSEKQAVEVDGTQYGYYMVRNGEEIAGCAVESATVGFGGTLKIMVGFSMDGIICGTSVLECNETPGLGAKCRDAAFSDQFKEFNPSVRTLKVSKDGGDVDAITASTITSRAFTLAVANAVKAFEAITADAEVSPEIIGGDENE